jgi:hypothetical protein
MSNEHLIPPAVIDLCNNCLDKSIPNHIRQNYVQRLEVTLAHLQLVLQKSMTLTMQLQHEKKKK